MALTNNAINRCESLVENMEIGAKNIGLELESLIAALKSNSNFTAFCAGAPIGNRIAEQLNQIQITISEKLVGGITSLAATTKAFLDNQTQINAANGTGGQLLGLLYPTIRGIGPLNLTFDEGANVFSAKGFDTLISQIKVHFSIIISSTKSVAHYCDDLSSNFASEDSNLSGVYAKLSTTLREIVSKLNTIVDTLTDELDKYAKATVANEEETAQQVESVNSTIDDVMSMLGNISI